MATLDEVKEASDVIAVERKARGFTTPLKDLVTILHCTSNYPAKTTDVNLRAMTTIMRETGLPVGYSDHTLGLAVSTGAVALGASVIEKHFTLDSNLPGPDHKASLEPAQLTALVRQIRDIERALGSAIKEPTASELPVRDVVRRSVTSVRSIAKGAAIASGDIALLRPGTGIAPAQFDAVIGRRAARDIAANETLQWTDLT